MTKVKPLEKSFIVECPSCKESFSYYTSKFRPFCSERCRMIDLGQWLREDYKVAGANAIIEKVEEGEDE